MSTKYRATSKARKAKDHKMIRTLDGSYGFEQPEPQPPSRFGLNLGERMRAAGIYPGKYVDPKTIERERKLWGKASAH